MAYKPRSRNRAVDWPSLVIEVGVSESIAQLQVDATFWIIKSGGQIHVVIVMAFDVIARNILIQQWETSPRTWLVHSTTRLYQIQYM